MASASSTAPFFGIREEELNSQMKKQQLASMPTSSTAASQTTAPAKKKRRNVPGNPYPDAEVIALSPKALMTTNRFICEVCNKGFQREQNLQLHRRGHNLPWKLRQKSTKEVRRRVYVCPELTCVHHDPSRALGDLTGVKKHFCRKHGEKKWKCDKCSKRYAVQSDYKAHSKTCGTREYRCDCGTLFSRRDSFITHRAFCDAPAQEGTGLPTGLSAIGSHLYGNSSMALGPSHQVYSQITSLQDQSHQSSNHPRLGGSSVSGPHFDHLISSPNPSPFRPPHPATSSAFFLGGCSNHEFNEETLSHNSLPQNKHFHGLMQIPDLQGSTIASSSATAAATANLFNLSFFSNSSCTSSINTNNNASSQNNHLLISDQLNNGNGATLISGNFMSDHMGASMSSFFGTSMQNESALPQMSATALLQKAAQMGSTTSGGSSLLQGFSSSSSSAAKRTIFQASFSGGSNGGGDGLRSQLENGTRLQDLMYSLANGNASLIGDSSGIAAFGGRCTTGGHEQESGGFGGVNSGFCNMDEAKFHLNLSAGSVGGSDQLTRDFLGVGNMVKSMRGGVSQGEYHNGLDKSSLDHQMKSASFS